MPSRFFLALLLSITLIGCGRQERAPKDGDKIEGVVLAPPTKGDDGKNLAALEPLPAFIMPGDPANEKYDAALTQALTLLADQDLPKALEAFETARAEKDTEFVRGEIDKLKSRIDADLAAKKTLAEIQAVLDDGNAKDAGKLVDQALQAFGGGAAAGKLVQLQAQADALNAAQTNEDPKVRFQRLRDQAQVALQDDNLRAATASLQQSLQLFDDAGVRDQLREVQGRLDSYDALRRKASEMRRDPNEVDEALEVYRAAAKAWNTPEVRQDIDDCLFALQRRRPTLSVADFEVLGDVGVPGVGDIVADELLPTFKARFDLIDREQVDKAFKDLNLGAGFQNNPEQQREVGRIARARFLVLGSVRRLGAVTVQARLVDTSSGLIVQTAKISAPTFDQVLQRLPELTKQLLMTDDEKLAFDQEQVRVAQRIEPVPANAPLPPAPVVGAQGAAGPWFDQAPPPAFGPLQVAQFRALPQPVVQQQVVIVEPPPPVFRTRLVHTVVLQGDGLFARGQYREAFRQYEFALGLAPNDFDIRARLDACRPLLPPVVVVPVAVRPRLAILNFFVVGDPRVVPPGLSMAAPDLLAPYFRMNFELVDPGEVYWTMARLGMTQADLMNDPNARRWLGRALHTQFFLMGTIEQTASFDVTTYLLNAEQGWVQGSGRMHVRNFFDLKMRAGELAQITQLPPGQRAQFLAAEPQVNLLLTKGQDNLRGGNFQIAITFFTQALALRPNNVQATLFLNQANQSHRAWEIEQARRKDLARQQALAAAAQQRQIELARAAEAARLRAAQESAARAEADQLAHARQRATAYGDMVAKARVAVQGKNFGMAVSLYQGALDLASPPVAGAPQPLVPLPVAHDVLLGELAQARAEVARANEQKAQADKLAAQESALRQQRDKQLAAARQKIEDDRRKAEADAVVQQKLIDAKYQAALDQGMVLLGQNKFESAIVALQGARQFKKTELVEATLNTAMSRQAEAVAQAKGEGERKALDEKLLAERKRKKAVEEEAKRNHDLYEQTLKQAQDALAQKSFDAAEQQFEAVGKLFKTDAVIAGLKQVRAGRAADLSVKQAEKEKASKAERVSKLVSSGVASLDAGKLAESVQQLEQARKLDPANVEVLNALSRAEQARNREILAQQQKAAAEESFKKNLALKQQQTAAEAALIQAAKEKAAKIALDEQSKKAAAEAAAIQAAKDKSAAEAALIQAAKQKAAKVAQEEQAKKAAAEAALIQAAKEKAAKIAQEEQSKKAAAEAALIQAAKEKAAKMAQEEQAKKAAAEAALIQAAKDSAAKLAQEQALKKILEEQSKKAAAEAALVQAAKDKAAKLAQEQALRMAQEEQAKKAAAEAAAIQAAKQKAAKLAQEQQLAEQKRKTNYAEAVQNGMRLAGQKQYPAAIQSYQAAKSLYPNDPQVNQLIAQTAQAWEASKKAVAPPPPPPPPPKKVNAPAEDPAKKKAAEDRAKYQEFMARGQQLLAQRQFAPAAQQFEAALRMVPGDPAATQLLQQARTAKK